MDLDLLETKLNKLKLELSEVDKTYKNTRVIRLEENYR